MDNNKLSFRQTYARVPSSENVNALNVDDTSIELQPLPNITKPLTVHPVENVSGFEAVHTNVKNQYLQDYSVTEALNGAGWKHTVQTVAIITSLAFVVNILALVWFARSPRSEEGLIQLYVGSCSTVESLDLWVHLAINILSTILLGASNYCMQCLCAPNRKEVDEAHRNGEWLDIGIPSVRNLSYLPKGKAIGWTLLALTSMPLHLLYNSAFYAAFQNNEYQYFFVTEDFPNGAAFNITPISDAVDYGVFATPFVDIAGAQQLASPWQRLDAEECVDKYARFFLREYRNLILITTNTTIPYNQTYAQLMAKTGWCEDGECGSLLFASPANSGGYSYTWLVTRHIFFLLRR